MRWKLSSCCASRWSRRRASWNTSTTSVATRRFRQTCRSGSRNAPRSTRQPQPSCVPTPTSPMNWKAPDSGADIARIKQQLDHYLDIREIVRKASGESLDLKPYEADMRHLIDTYIEADEPRKISPFDNMGLLELIVKTGIADAISKQLRGLKGNKNAIAETIENNVRRKIIKEQLNDPAFYEKMSALLDEIIIARKTKAIAYEGYLKRIAELAKRVEAGQAEETPKALNTPAKRALYNNLNQNEELALSIDATIRKTRPDGWRGIQAREQVIKAALFDVLRDVGEVERIFPIIKAQSEY